jgi:ribonuclease HI
MPEGPAHEGGEAGLLRAIYGAIDWAALYEKAPQASREAVDALFQRLARALPESEPAPPAPRAPAAPPGAVEELVIRTDGASRGNPGPAGIGAVLARPGGAVVAEISRSVGTRTNNQAEYLAVAAALERARELGARRVRLLADSELLVRQLQGVYRVRNAGIKPLFRDVSAALAGFEAWEIAHVPREENAHADALASAAAKGNAPPEPPSPAPPAAAAAVTQEPGAGPTPLDTVREAWVGRLARDLAHEFNNVLTALLGMVEMARGETDADALDASLQEAAGTIRQYSATLGSLLQATRGSAGPRLLMPAGPLETALQLLRYRLGRKGIELRKHVRPAPAFTADAAELTLVLVRAGTALWEAASEGDVLQARVEPGGGGAGACYTLALEPGGAPTTSPPLPPGELECMRALAARNGATIRGPETGEQTTLRWTLSIGTA